MAARTENLQATARTLLKLSMGFVTAYSANIEYNVRYDSPLRRVVSGRIIFDTSRPDSDVQKALGKIGHKFFVNSIDEMIKDNLRSGDVIVFTKKMSDGLSKVAVLIEKQSKARPEFKGWVTLVSEDSTQDANLLKWANEHNLAGTPVGRFEYNPGPPAYRLSTDSVTEVFVFKAGKVLHALKAKDEAEVEKLSAKLEEILKKAKN
jgi:hypothetical protein